MYDIRVLQKRLEDLGRVGGVPCCIQLEYRCHLVPSWVDEFEAVVKDDVERVIVRKGQIWIVSEAFNQLGCAGLGEFFHVEHQHARLEIAVASFDSVTGDILR